MKRKLWLGIGVAAMVGAALWMRELVSWRPVLVAKLGSAVWEIRVSNDGRFLAVAMRETEGYNGWTIDMENRRVDDRDEPFEDFGKKQESETFPRLGVNKVKNQLVFTPSRHRKVVLEWPASIKDSWLYDPGEAINIQFSPGRNEVYYQLGGEITIWDATTGNLKKQVRFAESAGDGAFSPDGKWLLAEVRKTEVFYPLCRYEVQSGRKMAVLSQSPLLHSFGFSPDGRFIWFIPADDKGDRGNFTVIRADTNRILWRAGSKGVAKWLPDGRIGLVESDGFSWRDATGRELRRLPGPFQNSPQLIVDWALSPDGKWIYSAEPSGFIRRWRAR